MEEITIDMLYNLCSGLLVFVALTFIFTLLILVFSFVDNRKIVKENERLCDEIDDVKKSRNDIADAYYTINSKYLELLDKYDSLVGGVRKRGRKSKK